MMRSMRNTVGVIEHASVCSSLIDTWNIEGDADCFTR